MTLNEAILDNLDQQIEIMVKILRNHLKYLEGLTRPTQFEKTTMTMIKEKLKEIDKLNNHD